MSLISNNLQVVRADLAAAAQKVGRDPQQISLLAVSKTFPAQAVVEAAEAGQLSFGENYLQEALDKILAVRVLLPDVALEWHFIGPIQSNKTRQIAENFSWVHSVDREKIAQRLSEQRPAGLPPLNICLQVNISRETSKSGVLPEETVALAKCVSGLKGLRLRGLMAVPEASEDPIKQRHAFQQLRELQQQVKQQVQQEIQAQAITLDTLSMGMSGDMAAAIAEGSTIVRIGSAIFGKRNYVKT
ncbi:MAG: YggS family pyridoxal phosphate-dependent enzyme [Pseudomonadota bacterium]